MNRKHVSKVGKRIGMACLLLACTTVQSCRDEYFYDDTEPTWLGESIYDELDKRGNFTNFLRVIDDLNYGLVLSQTGSKTLFVADDEAFMEGITKAWGDQGVKSYDDLTDAHKRIILNSAMLDNAYLLEMLSKQPSQAVNSEPSPGLSLRRMTSAVVTDTIPLLFDEDLPQNNKAWDTFRNGKGIRLALDATSTMLTHFTGDHAYMQNFQLIDWQKILGEDAKLTDYYIFDKKVIEGDITCKNGYVHQLDGLLIPPANMAEEIRKNGEGMTPEGLAQGELSTYLFSRVLDRFAVPAVASADVNADYNRLYHLGDDNASETVYEKRYYTEGTNRGDDGDFLVYKDVDGKEQPRAEGSLLFDPGWNAYAPGASNELNMGAIFAPSDAAFYKYFTDGGGKSLVEQFGKNANGLVAKIDSIPLDIVQALVRNHMQTSFNATVPSKFSLILNDARDDMGVRVDALKKCLMANNGVVYVMDTVYSPVRYVAVTAPVMLSDSLNIIYKAIEDYDYDKYLLSTGNKFGLVVSSDNAMVFYDPKTEREMTDERIAYKFIYNAKNQSVNVEKWTYDHLEGPYGSLLKKKSDSPDATETLLKQILEYNIIVGDLDSKGLNLAGEKVYPKYYMTKGYGSVKVNRDDNGKVVAVSGGRELENKKSIPVAFLYPQTNGYTLQLDEGLMQPATQSVYWVLQKSEFEKFRTLSTTSPSTELLEYIGVSTPAERKKYTLFVEGGLDKNVRLFDTYHYTVYVPSNDAMDEAHAKGLPTWAELEAERTKLVAWASDSVGKLKKAFAESKLEADSLKLIAFKQEITQDSLALKANVELVRHFVKYHFQDNSIFVDNVRHEVVVAGEKASSSEYDGENYETSALDTKTNKFCSVRVKTAEKDGVETLSVRGDFSAKQATDPDYNTCYVMNANAADENVSYNVMTRDIVFKGNYIYTSSYAVVHQIDGFLANDVIFDAETDKFKIQ